MLSSHGEAGRFFVTFLDNHDMKERFRAAAADGPDLFDPQVMLGIAVLFGLQGIPCLYYGTEQGLHGRGDSDQFVREALWGKPTPSTLPTPSMSASNDCRRFAPRSRRSGTAVSISGRSQVMAFISALRRLLRASLRSHASSTTRRYWLLRTRTRRRDFRATFSSISLSTLIATDFVRSTPPASRPRAPWKLDRGWRSTRSMVELPLALPR